MPLFSSGAFADSGQPGLADDLGRYGIDPDTQTVWAVLNHNGSFAVAVVPEPATLTLVGLGMAAWLTVRRNRKA